MNVIFLDHDGVICLHPQWGSRFDKQDKFGRKLSQNIRTLPVDIRFDNFDKKAVLVLNEILEEVDVEIVVSSDWKRWADVDELGEYYEEQGIIQKPIDITPFFNDVPVRTDYNWTYAQRTEQQRSLEILQWLDKHPDVDNWVAVDDLHMGNEGNKDHWGLDNFVWTPREREGIKQSGVKEKIIKFLKN